MVTLLKLTVIICTRNRTDDLLTCLQSLAQQTVMPYETIIVDSSTVPLTDQETYTQAVTHLAQLPITYLHTAPGLTFQRNRGIERATGDVILFFDDDVTLSHDYLAAIERCFREHPDYAGGMGNVTNIKGYRYNLYRLYRQLFLLDRNHASGIFTLSGMPTHSYGNTAFQTIEVLGGCCMAFRTWALTEQKFDEKLRFYGYMEDCDISARLAQKYPLFYCPDAQLEHHESPLGRDRIRENRAMYVANYSYLFFKNFYPCARWKIIFFCWTVIGLLLEGVLRFNKDVFLGYCKGLIYAFKHHFSQPYAPRVHSSPTVS